MGWQVLELLVSQRIDLAGLVIHPGRNQKYVDQILKVANLPAEKVFDGSRLRDPSVVAAIAGLEAEIGISVLFDFILEPNFINLFPRGVVNLHPSLLPFNRGQYPNVWSIIEKTPSGATLHFIDEGVDTGDIMAQKEVSSDLVDTGETLYHKLELACFDLFRETWPLIKSGKPPRTSQSSSGGTVHLEADVDKIDRIELDSQYAAGDLINILRARTFPPHKGAFFEHAGKRVYMRLHLECDTDN